MEKANKEQVDLLKAFEEGIIVVKDDSIDFENDNIEDLKKRFDVPEGIDPESDRKSWGVFSIYRETKSDEE